MDSHKPAGSMPALVVPVILSGGAGTRLWPLSRNLYPKQLLPLASGESLLIETVRRVGNRALFSPPVIVSNQEHRFIVAEQLRESGVSAQAIVLEPEGRSTAPAAAVACLLAIEACDDPLVLIMPSDHLVRDVEAFQEAVRVAASAAREGALVMFGIKPAGPETGYGYIRQGKPLDGLSGCCHVKAFIEKPDLEHARSFVETGEYYWNSGMFLFQASSYLAELQRLEPKIFDFCQAAVKGLTNSLDFTLLPVAAFAACPSVSIDNGVMERTAKAALVPVDFGWSDVGSWATLWDIGEKDNAGNVLVGDVIAEKTKSSYIRSSRPLVAALGVENLVIIATDDAVLVMAKDQAQDVKHIVGRLKTIGRKEIETHVTVHRPWGDYQTIDLGDRFVVKRITVKPGRRLSLQMHYHRAEHWVVVKGTAVVNRGDDQLILRENESIYIPAGTAHRLENPGKIPLHLIEVQSGTYLEEDDIVRFTDDFKRV